MWSNQPFKIGNVQYTTCFNGANLRLRKFSGIHYGAQNSLNEHQKYADDENSVND